MGTGGSSEEEINAKALKIAVLVSRYNSKICDGLKEGALGELERLGLPRDKVKTYSVPGAFELPLLAKSLANSQKYDAIICLGAVIRGDTSHFDYVCSGVTQGLMRTMLETSVPMAFGVLTTDTEEQAVLRSSPDGNNKGLEAAQTAIEMALLLKEVR